MPVASIPEEVADETLGTIAGYRLFEPIGRGGSATVYRAEQRGDGFLRPVALKIIDRFADAPRLRRFDAEKRILAALEHPGIARLYDAGFTSTGRPYLAMELVRGSDLLEHCRRTGASTRERIALFLLVLDAVEHAHRASVVHRDLKPGNVVVSEQSTPKLLDFGIARLLSSEETTGGGTIDTTDTAAPEAHPTETRLSPWTPSYASPEQVAGDKVDRATDLYSLGVVIYELLTGRRPYRLADDRLETLERAIREQPPEPPGLGRELDSILAKALEKRPADRYLSAADFAADLRRHLEGRPIFARPVSQFGRLGVALRRRGASSAVLSLLLVVALVALAALLGGPSFRRARETSGPADPAASPFLALPVAAPAQADFAAGLDALARFETRRAVARLRAAADADPDQPLIRAALATAHSRAGHDYLARAEGRRALDLAPAEPRESRLLAEATALQTSGDKARELERRRSLWVLSPTRFEAGYLLAKSLNDGGTADEALEVVARLRALPAGRVSPNDLRLGLLEAEALNQLGRPADAARAASTVAGEAMRRRLSALAANALLLESLAQDGLGATEAMDALAVRAHRLFVPLGETWGVARALNLRCIARVRDSRAEEAERICGDCIRMAERAGSATTAARGLANLGMSRRHAGRIAEARALYVRAIETEARGPLRDRMSQARYLHNLANLDSDLGHLPQAEEGYRKSAVILREAGNRLSLLRSLNALAAVLMYRGSLAEVESVLAEASALAGSAGSARDRGIVLWRRGDLAKLEGDLPLARSLYDQAAGELASNAPAAIAAPFEASRKQLAPSSERACRDLESSHAELVRLEDRAENELAIGIARCYDEAGFPRRAQVWLDRAAPGAASSQLPAIRTEFELVRAALALKGRRFDEADRVLTAATAACREFSLGTQLMEVRLLSARLALQRGEHPERVRTLAEELLRDAEAGRFGKAARGAREILAAPRLARG